MASTRTRTTQSRGRMTRGAKLHSLWATATLQLQMNGSTSVMLSLREKVKAREKVVGRVKEEKISQREAIGPGLREAIGPKEATKVERRAVARARTERAKATVPSAMGSVGLATNLDI